MRPSLPLLPRRLATRPPLLVLAVILLIAAAFRLNALESWDVDSHQHPDERFMTIVASQVKVPASPGDYFNTPRSSLNPYANGQPNYAYGQWPLTMTRVVAELADVVVPIHGPDGGPISHTSYDVVYGVGRVLSVLADLGTIAFAWLLARRVFGLLVAHLTALLLSVTVLHIQLSHFFAVDTFATCFAAGALFFGQRAWQRDSLRDALLAGAFVGLAMASKISAVILLPVLGLVFIFPRRGMPSWAQFLDGLTAFGVALVSGLIAFRLTEPYAFLGPAVWGLRLNPQWFADKAYQVEVSSGRIDVPFMTQWAGTGAYTFVLQNIVQWAMGPALGIACILGLAAACWRLVAGHRQEREALLVIIWTLANLAYFGGQFAKFLRYLLPTYFTFIMLAAYVLVVGADWLRGFSRWRLDRAYRFAAPAVVTLTAGWALAFSYGVYGQPLSRVQASDWIYQNVPAGATLATEHWDDRLPLPRPGGGDPGRYKYAELALYEDDTPEKRIKLEGILDQSQYIIMSSRRLIGSIPRLPERYPMTTAYYRLLQSSQLGFELVGRFQVEPGLGPLRIDDSNAQEDFTVYDHPLVEIWHKRPDYASVAVRQQLDAVPLDRVVHVKPVDGGKGALLQSMFEEQTQVAAGTWSQLFNRADLVNALSLPVWLVLVELLAFSAVPVLWRVLPFTPDRGFGASKILALAFVAYVSWLVASLKLAPFDRPLLLLTWALLAAASFAAIWRSRASFREWLLRERALIMTIEGVFLVGFALFAWIRAANPDLWHPTFGGEKPMNFAYLNAVVKSQYFPPYDPWFAGGIINYYYFGFVLVALPIKLSGILPEIGFNLAEPTLYGALCAGVFSIAFALSVPVRNLVRRRWHAYVAGIAAVLLTGVLGNLDAGLQIFDQLWKLGGELSPTSSGVLRLLAGVLALFQGAHFPILDFWRSTRFIGPEEVGPIHEFPYFTFLYGDLHAHQIALPITVATLFIGLNLQRSLRADARRIPWAPLIVAGVLVAMLRATNTWDFPTYAAIVVLLVLLGSLPALLRLEQKAIRTVILSLLVFGIVFAVSFTPYLQRYQLFYNGVDPVKARTALSQFLTIHGLFFYLGASLFLWYVVQARRRVAAMRERRLVAEPGYYGMILPLGLLNGQASLATWVAGVTAFIGVALMISGYATRGFLIVGIGAAVAACVAHWRRANRLVQAALFGVALFATLIPELVALQGDVGRMNTVFKFYLQAWVLLSITAAVALGWLARQSVRDHLLRQIRPAWIALLAIFVLAAVAYPLLASKGKIGLRFAELPLSLDGMQYMDYAQYSDDGTNLSLPGDAQAIRWLQDNVIGTPVVLEGRSPVYRWGSRISIYTGLPTILGWDVHQSQQRTGYSGLISARVADVERAYSSPNPAETLAILDRYQVKYVVIGGLERKYYPQSGLAKFADMPRLRGVYDAEGVQIYEVVS